MNPNARPRWGQGGMPNPPPDSGLRRGQYMSNADIAALGMSPPSPPIRAPAGGASVGGVNYPGGSWLPVDAENMILRATVRFDRPEQDSVYRTVRMPMPAGANPRQIQDAWDRFMQRWRARYPDATRVN
jgi:hypothetical protein